PHQVEHVLRTLGEQRDVKLQLTLLTHGFEVDPATIRALARDHGVANHTLLAADASVPLGDCLNRLVDAAEGQVLAKMDDDDHYGPNYLADALHAMSYSGAELVGKQAHYVYLAGADVMALRRPDLEHRSEERRVGSERTAQRTAPAG